MATDLCECVFLIIQFNRLSAWEGAKTEPVSADEGTTLLNQLDKAAVIHFRADKQKASAAGLFLRFPGLQLFQGFLELFDQKVFRTDVGCKCQDMEFITGDSRFFFLAEIPDFMDQPAHRVMLFHCFADFFVRNIDTVFLVQRFQNVVGALDFAEVYTVFICLQRNFHVFMEKPVVSFSHSVQQLHVFHAAVYHGAAIRRNDAVGKVKAAFDCTLQQCPAGFTEKICHVIGSNVH